jgi:hypothetical protein
MLVPQVSSEARTHRRAPAQHRVFQTASGPHRKKGKTRPQGLSKPGFVLVQNSPQWLCQLRPSEENLTGQPDHRQETWSLPGDSRNPHRSPEQSGFWTPEFRPMPTPVGSYRTCSPGQIRESEKCRTARCPRGQSKAGPNNLGGNVCNRQAHARVPLGVAFGAPPSCERFISTEFLGFGRTAISVAAIALSS